MPVQLDWEIEDVDTRLPEIDRESHTSSLVCRRRLRLLAFAVLAVTVGLAFIAFRLRHKKNMIEGELRAIVQLELSALTDGDRDLFLGRQDPDDLLWRSVQEEAFYSYPRPVQRTPWENAPQSLHYTGQVPTVHVQQDKAWAQVEVARDGRTWRQLWFFEWIQDRGWRHVRCDENWLGQKRVLRTLHFRFSYPERDRAIVAALARAMEAWYNSLTPLFGAKKMNRPLLWVRFTYREPVRAPALAARQSETSFTLEVPSLHQVHMSADGGPTPELRRQMADYMAEAIVSQAAGLQPNNRLAPASVALRAELRDWVVARLARDASSPTEWTISPTPMADALVASHGVQIIPLLAEGLREAHSLDQALARAGAEPPDSLMRLTFHLAASSRAFHAYDESAYLLLMDPQADESWRQFYLNQLRQRHAEAQAGHLWRSPSSLQIDSITFRGALAAIEVETAMHDGSIYHQLSFFRRDGDNWLLTSPDPAFFGNRRVARTQNLVFEYFEPDAEWLEERIPSALQAILTKTAVDLGIPIDGRVFTITTELQPGINEWWSEHRDRARLTSPSIAGWPVDHLDHQVIQMTLPLLANLFPQDVQNEDDVPLLFTYIAAMLWELERLFPEHVSDALFVVLFGVDTPQVGEWSLADLWAATAYNPEDRNWAEFANGYHLLVDFLAETFGPEVVPALLDNVSLTDDLDQWLRLSTGHGLEEIDPAWQVWVMEKNQEN